MRTAKYRSIGLICCLIIILITAGCCKNIEDSPPYPPMPFKVEGLDIKMFCPNELNPEDYDTFFFEAEVDKSGKTFVIKYQYTRQRYISVEAPNGEKSTLYTPAEATKVEFDGGNYEWIPTDGEYHTIKFTIAPNKTGSVRDFVITLGSDIEIYVVTAKLILRQNM